MRRRPGSPWFPMVLGLATACGGTPLSTATTLVRDSAGITITENVLPDSLPLCVVDSTPALRIGALDGDEAYLFHRVFGATRLSDGRIVVVNQGTQQIRYFDSTGRFLRSSGRAGEGPGEFRDAFYLWTMPGDTVWVGDYRPWQFLVFGPDGEWVRTVRPTPYYLNLPAVLNVLTDGRAVLANDDDFSPPSTQFSERHLTVLLHHADGTLADTIGTWPNGRWGVVEDIPGAPTMFPLFESFVRFATHGNRILAGHGATPEVRVYTTEPRFSLSQIIRWTTGDRTISPGHIAAERHRLSESFATSDPARLERLVKPLISEARPVADQFPAFAGLLSGRDGRTWIREYRRPGTGNATSWLGLDEGGKVECRAMVPAVDQVYEFGRDYILALDTDEDEVPQVVQLRIARPPNP